MRLSLSLVLSLLMGTVQAISETAKVYIFQQPEFPTSFSIPTLSQEETRLVIAQRFGNSKFYTLKDASTESIAYINTFGGQRKQLFEDDNQEVRSQFLIIVDGVTPHTSTLYQNTFEPAKPAFEISSPSPVEEKPLRIVDPDCELRHNNIYTNAECWPDLSKIKVLDAGSAETLQQVTQILAKMIKSDVDVMIILLPGMSHSYKLYDLPSRTLWDRGAQLEEPMEGSDIPPTQQVKQAKGKDTSAIYSTCYSTNDTCQNVTNNCSGHGHCYERYKSEIPGDSCYACTCIPSINITHAPDGQTELARRTYWAGAACQKEDVSSSFWLIIGVTVALMGLAGMGIGMLFSIGEEKLPSVIGAGVSSSRSK